MNETEMSMMFNFLQSFRLVYETRSFSIAAKQLFVTQPTISNQIKQLENSLQTMLFHRNGNHDVIPTKAADLLYQESTVLLSKWNTVEQEIKSVDEGATHQITIGVSQSISQIIMPALLQCLERHFRATKWSVVVSNSETVINQLKVHQVQLGLVEKPLVAEGVKRVTVMEDELVCVGKQTGIWFNREIGSGIQQYTQQYLTESGTTPQQLIMINNLDLIIRLVKNGMGQAIISRRMVPDGMSLQQLGPHFMRNFYLVYEKSELILDDYLTAVKDYMQLSLKEA